MLATEADPKPNRTKIAILLSVITRMRWSDTTIWNAGMIRWTIQRTIRLFLMRTTNKVTPNLLKIMPVQANDNRNVLRSDVYSDVVKRFELEFVWEKRVVFARYRFWINERAEEQNFDDYTTELHTLANVCEFKEHENMIRDFPWKTNVFRNVSWGKWS